MSWESLLRAVGISALLSAGGLALGVLIAGLLIPACSRWKGQVVGTVLSVGLKSVPAFIFPLMFGSFAGPGIMMKVTVSGLICFFPILVGALEGRQRVPPGLLRMAQVYGATAPRRFAFVEVRWLFGGLLEGLKAAAPLAVVGAIVAEFVDAAEITAAGLGMMFASNRSHPGTLFILSIASTALGCFLYVVVALAKTWIDQRLRLV